MYEMHFGECRKGPIFQKEFTVYSIDCSYVVFCIRTLSLPVLYGDWNTGRHGYSATSTNRDNSYVYPFYFHAVCMEKTVGENEI
jgi:hypothetical protein